MTNSDQVFTFVATVAFFVYCWSVTTSPPWGWHKKETCCRVCGQDKLLSPHLPCVNCAISAEGQTLLDRMNEEHKFKKQVEALLELMKWDTTRTKTVETALNATKGDAIQALTILRGMDK